jgi:hypothetical protein
VNPTISRPAITDEAYLEYMARVDGCPDACGNTETPYRIEIEAEGFRAFYGCTDCGQFWNTGWRD